MNRQFVSLIFTLSVLFFAGANGHCTEKSAYEALYKDLPFEMPQIHKPVFPNHTVTLSDFGGIPDGIQLNSEAFEKAFAALAGQGGGTLVVPAGIWLTGPIVFRSNIHLHLEKGALILFSPDHSLYPLVKAVYEGTLVEKCQSPVSGYRLENIAITGEGVIDGSGEAWRPVKKMKVTENHWKQLLQSGGILKDPGYWQPIEKDYLRPVMVNFVECKNLWLEGTTFQNSPGWNLHPLMCENVIIDRITVRNPNYAQNGDGLDLESCVNTIIANSTFDVGDDGICLKSGKDEEGRKRGRPTMNVIIDNCKVFKGHGGFVVGSEMSGGVRNISVSNCLFLGTDVGLRFKAGRGRGGVVEQIYIRNIYMFDITTEPFLFDLYYGGATDSSQIFPADETTPVFRNISVKNLTARNAKRAMFFNGLPEMKISNVRLENVIISSKTGAEISEADGLFFKNVRIQQEEGEKFILNNVENMIIDDNKQLSKK